MLKKLLFGFGLFILLLSGLIFRPVPIVKENKALSVRGTVAKIYEGGEHDIVFLLENNPVRYYINRGMEQFLLIDDLQVKMLGKKVLLKYPEYWTPLDWNNRIRHISKVEFEGLVIFNELK